MQHSKHVGGQQAQYIWVGHLLMTAGKLQHRKVGQVEQGNEAAAAPASVV